MFTESAGAELTRDFRESMHVDDTRADLREFPLGLVRVGQVQLFRDGEAEDRVAEKFETFVGGQTTVLVGVRAVRQRQDQ